MTAAGMRAARIGSQRQQGGDETIEIDLLAVDGHHPRRLRPGARTSPLLAILATSRHRQASEQRPADRAAPSGGGSTAARFGGEALRSQRGGDSDCAESEGRERQFRRE